MNKQVFSGCIKMSFVTVKVIFTGSDRQADDNFKNFRRAEK